MGCSGQNELPLSLGPERKFLHTLLAPRTLGVIVWGEEKLPQELCYGAAFKACRRQSRMFKALSMMLPPLHPF